MDLPQSPVVQDDTMDLSTRGKYEIADDYSIEKLMREDDAEMLERGVEDSSEPPTPYEGPTALGKDVLSPPSVDIGESAMSAKFKSLCEEIEPIHVKSDTSTCVADGGSSSLHRECHPQDHQHNGDTSTSSRLSRAFEHNDSDQENHHQARFLNDKDSSACGSVDQDQPESAVNSQILQPDDSSMRLCSPNSVSDQFDESKTYHRRLHEAAQFAEAVGEKQDDMIQVIIDDDDDDESDEDDESPDEEGAAGVENDTENDARDEQTSPISIISEHAAFNCPSSSIKKQRSFLQSPLEQHDTPMSMTPEVRDDSFQIGDSFQFVDLEEHKNGEHLTSKQNGESHPAHTKNPHRFPSERSLSESNLKDLNAHDKEKESQGGKPMNRRSASYHFFRHKLPLEEKGSENTNDVFKGIVSPEVTKRGISRGNYAQLHRKAWLEVSDKFHRYGKNLRTYYKHWEKLGHPTNMFFDWLDVKGEAAGWELPNLPDCPREVLDNDRVLYITDSEEQARYLLKIVPQGKTCDELNHGKVGSSTKIVDRNGNPVRTGPSGWIFVLRDHEIYGSEKRTKPKGDGGNRCRFHHSSFFGGKAVAAAGILITDENGCLSRLYPHSGHYRPGEAHMQRMLYHLYQCGVELGSFQVDMQQIMHVSREVRDARTPKGGTCDIPAAGGSGQVIPPKKAKKTDSLHLKDATFVSLFLAHKARCIGKGLFKMIHKIRPIRRVDGNSVRIILDAVDHGGVWTHGNMVDDTL